MSINLSDLCEAIDDAVGTDSVSFPTAKKIKKINQAQDDVYTLGLKARGWNMDDFNHTHDPFITIDLVDGQRDYHFTDDEQGNLILDIHRVMVRQSATGEYKTIIPVDIQSDKEEDVKGFIDGNDTEGIPTKYEKTGNGIFLDYIPSYSATAGLKIYISREASYFTGVGDTMTAYSGIDGLCHDYLYLKPAYEYARDKGLTNSERLYRDLQDSLKKVRERYGSNGKEKDKLAQMTMNIENCR